MRHAALYQVRVIGGRKGATVLATTALYDACARGHAGSHRRAARTARVRVADADLAECRMMIAVDPMQTIVAAFDELRSAYPPG